MNLLLTKDCFKVGRTTIVEKYVLLFFQYSQSFRSSSRCWKFQLSYYFSCLKNFFYRLLCNVFQKCIVNKVEEEEHFFQSSSSFDPWSFGTYLASGKVNIELVGHPEISLTTTTSLKVIRQNNKTILLEVVVSSPKKEWTTTSTIIKTIS